MELSVIPQTPHIMVRVTEIEQITNEGHAEHPGPCPACVDNARAGTEHAIGKHQRAGEVSSFTGYVVAWEVVYDDGRVSQLVPIVWHDLCVEPIYSSSEVRRTWRRA